MRKSFIRAEAVPDVGSLAGAGPRLRNIPVAFDEEAEVDDEAVAAYLLDLMIASRRLAVKRGFNFLAYLIGIAAEESRLLSVGRSGARRSGD
ncbi:hypothetical protein [Parvibaculum sp.]|jgi:hypothetical protein|uniref:hypothetical protein n=1 Tax=Parvibaculum sp. TaxID=2024848 RepID=UPI003C73DFF3